MATTSTMPDATNRPHMISSNVLAYIDGNGIAQQVTLKPLPAPGSTFGTDANGDPNNGARVNSDGSVTITKDGTVLDGYIFTGTVTIQANNVTIENFRLDASGTFYGIYKAWETKATGTVIQDGEITGAQYGVSAHDFTALRLNIHDTGEDGVISSGNNGTVLDFYIHNLGTLRGAHADGIQVSSGSNWLIRGNNIDISEANAPNAAVFFQSYFGPVDNMTVDGNWLNGGVYIIMFGDPHQGYGETTNIFIENNYFGHDYIYGILSSQRPADEWTNNRWEDTNLLVNANGSTLPGNTEPVDTTRPTISSVVASPSTATLTTGNTVTLTVNFNETVTVSSGGQPTLTLNNGGTANYVSGSGSRALTFRYIVVAGQDTADLTVTSLNLNSATIRDAAGNDAVRSGAATNPAGTLAIDTTPPAPVDTTRPTISSVVASPSTATLTTGNTVTLTVNFNETVTVSSGGQPTLTLNNGGTANYVSGSGSRALTFRYIVVAGQDTADLTVTSLNLNSATIRDAAGNDAVRSGAATNPAGTLAIDTTPPAPVDTTRPTISSVVASPSTATLTTGNTVTLTVNFNETVTVSSGGQPTLTLNNGGTANYVSGSGSRALTFRYIVVAGQDTADLTVTSLSLNSATICDAAGNDAVRSGAATNPAGTLAIDTTPPAPVDTTRPTISSVVASPSTATLTTGNTVTLTVNFNETVTVSSGGQPTLTLNNGGTANYVSGSGSRALTFRYIVVAGQDTADLTVTSLNLNSATIRDAAGNDAVRSGAATNPAGTLAIDTTPPAPVDTTAPLLTSVSPTDNSTDVARDSNLVLTFNETVVRGSGNIVIHNRSDGTNKSIAVTDSQVTFSGNKVTIDPSNYLAADSNYYVTVEPGAIRDVAGNDYAGISNRWSFNFTTDAPAPPAPVDTTAPLLTSVSPTDNSTDVSRYSNLVLTFSEPMVPGSGNIVIHNRSDGTIAESIPVTDANQVTFSGDTVTIDPSSAFKSGSSYYVTVEPGAIRDVAGNDYAGISNRWSFNFTTADGRGPYGHYASQISSGTEATTANSDIGTTVQTEILGLYAALYDRAAEAPGYSYWVSVVAQQPDAHDLSVANANSTLVTVHDAQILGRGFVLTQSEFFDKTYGSLNDSDFVNAMYVNIGGNAGDPGGVQYWANLLQQAENAGQSGQNARAGLVGQFVHDLVGYDINTLPSGLTDQQWADAALRTETIDNKIAVSIAYEHASQQPDGAVLIPHAAGDDPAYQATMRAIEGVTSDGLTVDAATSNIANAVAAQDLTLIQPVDANIALLAQYAASAFAKSAEGFGGTVVNDPQPTTSTEVLTQPRGQLS